MRGKKIIGLSLVLFVALAFFLLPGCGTQHNVSTYSVTYNANGATSGDAPTDSTRYQSDISVTVLGNPNNLQKAGYVFAGWNTDPGGTGTNYIAGQKFSIKSSDATLYACWSDRSTTYTVTYNGNGNTGGSVPTDPTSYKAGQLITVKGNTGNLTRTGYSFAGWNSRADGTGHVYTQADTFAMGLANVTIYANWSSKTTYMVTYDGNGATSGTVPVDTTNYETGHSITVLDNTGSLAKTGSTFVGWNTNAAGTGTTYSYGQEFIMGSANITLYAKWSTQTTYSVTYDGNGNTSGSAPTNATYYETGQLVEVLANTGNLEKEGYYFAGWNTKADGTGTTYLQDHTFVMGSGNVTLYAKWGSTVAFTVTYDGNENIGGSAPTDSNTYAPGYSVTVLGNPGALEKTGYVFAGWNTRADGSGTVYTQADTFAMGFGNITLYANWTTDTTYTVTYSSNEATSGTVPIDYINYKTGYSVTVFDNTGILEKTGYSFAGWNTLPDGSGVTYSYGQEFIMGLTNVTLYAKWANATYSVDYDGNGNTSGVPPGDMTNYETGQLVHVLGNFGNLEKTDYRFVGWNTEATGTGERYTPGQTFPMGAANVTLYANWETDLCLVTFNSMGGSSASSQEVINGAKISEPEKPTKSDYTFAGWFKDAICTDPWFFDTDRVSSDMTLYAKWTINEYSVSFNSQGGSVVSPQTIEHGQKVSRPADPTRGGAIFTGWFKDRECTESWVFETDVVKNNLELYAGWKGIATITFDSQGGTFVEPQMIKVGGIATMPTRPSKGDLAIAGWFKDSACTNQWVFTHDTVTADITLYAKWATYNLRDRGPAGGWVCYDKGQYSNGWRYIEAAPRDLPRLSWGPDTETNVIKSGIGEGETNTIDIINRYGTAGNYAALFCRRLIIGDYADWFLPTIDEINMMRTNLSDQRVGDFYELYYWTSSENEESPYGRSLAYYVQLWCTTRAAITMKSTYMAVRPARYF